MKKFKDDPVCGFSDWASLEFLSTVDGINEFVPCFYGGDIRGRFFMMEDLGESKTLADVFADGDSVVTEKLLVQMAGQMGKLAGLTLGKESQFEHLRQHYPGNGRVGRFVETESWQGTIIRVEAWLKAAGLQVPPGFMPCMDVIADTCSHPPDCLVFSHGDPAPSNAHVKQEIIRLIDFEYGAYRHALYDITAWNLLCPLPESWVGKMSDSFRKELSSYICMAQRDEWYSFHWAVLSAYRAFAMMSWFPIEILEEDRPWLDEWTMRAAMISTCLRLAHSTEGVESLRPLAEVGGMLSRNLQDRWPESGDGKIRWPGAPEDQGM